VNSELSDSERKDTSRNLKNKFEIIKCYQRISRLYRQRIIS